MPEKSLRVCKTPVYRNLHKKEIRGSSAFKSERSDLAYVTNGAPSAHTFFTEWNPLPITMHNKQSARDATGTSF